MENLLYSRLLHVEKPYGLGSVSKPGLKCSKSGVQSRKVSRNYETARFTEIVKGQLSGLPVGDKQLPTALFPVFTRKLRWGRVEGSDLQTETKD